ncbi:HNH endonuclease signature motif containing protein [Euzebya tangerina]|uniref:HNH endonuclease signature motif containing protein n=1 Tax=Euzebya tangerina TaxID=591198 RepID=UPI000E31122E|nr:HNH endonuclease signature motif containing protein [Euzebya tangerina]
MSAPVINPSLEQPSGWVSPVDDVGVDEVPADDIVCKGAPHPAGPDSSAARPQSAADQLTGLLQSLDAGMAEAIALVRKARQTGAAERESGLPLERLVSLATGRTGGEVRFLCRAEKALCHLPAVDAAFAQGRLSWSQVRGIVSAVKGLRVAQMAELDGELGPEIGQGEPDRIVQRAFGWADVITAEDTTVEEQDPGDRRTFRVQPDLFGGAAYHGYDRLDAVTAIAEAAEAAADPPAKPVAVRVDADGSPVPAELLPSTARSAQLAEGLRRVAAAYLAGALPTSDRHEPPDPPEGMPSRPALDHAQTDVPQTIADQARARTDSAAATPNEPHTHGTTKHTNPPGGSRRTLGQADHVAHPTPRPITPSRASRPPRPTISIVIDHRDLPSATGRALTRWHGGPIPLTRLTVDRLLCDPHLTTVVTDAGRPIAVGDATSPITRAHYRTLYAVDHGCRLPGCTAPPQHCDAHHIIPRSRGGPTSTDNLMLLCRDCHSRVHTRGLRLELDRHTRAVTLTTPDGRTYTSLPA